METRSVTAWPASLLAQGTVTKNRGFDRKMVEVLVEKELSTEALAELLVSTRGSDQVASHKRLRSRVASSHPDRNRRLVPPGGCDQVIEQRLRL